MESFRYYSTGFPSLFSQIFSLSVTNKRYFVFLIDSHSKNFREMDSRKLLNYWLLGAKEAADWEAAEAAIASDWIDACTIEGQVVTMGC